MARTIQVIGNWKQNFLRAEAEKTCKEIAEGLKESEVFVGIAAPYLSLERASEAANIEGAPRLTLFAQDVAAQDQGAFTGEVGPAMLADVGIQSSLIGHSERRQFFGDSDALIANKTRYSLEQGMRVVLCVGESLDQRESGQHQQVVAEQLRSALSDTHKKNSLESLPLDSLSIAYEPVWAIGTGKTATPAQAGEMHAHIRSWLKNEIGAVSADRSILYGGSVKPTNAKELISTANIDGFLVGGASLDPASFLAIVAAASEA